MSSSRHVASKAAHSSARIGLSSLGLVALGAVSAFLRLIAPFHGYLVMVLGLAVGLAGVVTAIVGIHATRPHKQRHGRTHALRGLVLSLAAVVFVLFPAVRVGDVPRINDITTDLDNPPIFVSAVTLDANRKRDMGYPGEEFARQQRWGYPDLSHLILAVPPDVAFDRARVALAAMPRLRITGEDRKEGRIEAVQTSVLFHFADDVVVRVRAFEGGSKIDVRSKSRDGKADLGVNAARIRDLFARIGSQGSERSDRAAKAE